jgi:hypothetical protein
VEKFISTTIRPTKLGYLEFYDFAKCAEYVSNFIAYEPLEDPLDYPTYIPSPTSVIEWQKGDCFDVSIFLCSLLIGVGYDAYCVIGRAPSEITLKNEGLMENPHLNVGLKDLEYKKEEIPPPEFSTYKIHEREKAVSAFDRDEINEKLRIEEEDLIKNNVLGDDEPDRLPPDQFEGKRVHCWVLVKKGLRGVDKHYYIEPSTGRTWAISDRSYPYLSVDQVFNNKNFWINLKVSQHIDQVNFDSMNNGEVNDWEYVMIDTVEFPTIKGRDEDEEIQTVNNKGSKSINVKLVNPERHLGGHQHHKRDLSPGRYANAMASETVHR